MIIWINGAFGSGKTQTAYELNKRVKNSFVFDPEETGFYIRSNMPTEIKLGDFQDYPMWREFNNSMIKYIQSHYTGTVFVPMTVTNKDYLKEMMKGADIQHCTLVAKPETLLRRLRKRGDRENTWAAHQIARCVKSFSKDDFEAKIITDDLSIDQVVEKIANTFELELLPDDRSHIKKTFDRILVWKKHMNFANLIR